MLFGVVLCSLLFVVVCCGLCSLLFVVVRCCLSLSIAVCNLMAGCPSLLLSFVLVCIVLPFAVRLLLRLVVLVRCLYTIDCCLLVVVCGWALFVCCCMLLLCVNCSSLRAVGCCELFAVLCCLSSLFAAACC